MTSEYEDETQTGEAELIDAKEAEEIKKANQPLAGDYVTDPESFGDLTITREVLADDNDRVLYQLAGRMRSARRGHEDTVNFIRFRLSRDRRAKRDYETNEEVPGKDDIKSRLYSDAVDVYKGAHDDATPKTMKDLTEWLASTPGVRVNTMVGDRGDLIVLRIKPARG